MQRIKLDQSIGSMMRRAQIDWMEWVGAKWFPLRVFGYTFVYGRKSIKICKKLGFSSSGVIIGLVAFVKGW